jgi:hypothetical protein
MRGDTHTPPFSPSLSPEPLYVAYTDVDLNCDTLTILPKLEPSPGDPPPDNASSLSACRGLCDSDPLCVVFMWVPSGGGGGGEGEQHPSGCSNCCWTRRAPSCAATAAVGATTYARADGEE